MKKKLSVAFFVLVALVMAAMLSVTTGRVTEDGGPWEVETYSVQIDQVLSDTSGAVVEIAPSKVTFTATRGDSVITESGFAFVRLEPIADPGPFSIHPMQSYRRVPFGGATDSLRYAVFHIPFSMLEPLLEDAREHIVVRE